MISTLSAFLLASLLAQQVKSPPDPPEPWKAEYGIAYYAGRCLVAKCQVFRGYIAEQPPKDPSTVAVQMTEVLLGPPPETNPVVLAHQQLKPGVKNGFEKIAWSRAVLAINVPVTVLVALGDGTGVRPGHPFLVTSNDRDIEALGTAVSEIKRLSEDPERIVDDVSSLSTFRDGAMAGYLVAYLEFREPSLARKAELLPKILASTSVPASQLYEVALTTATCFDDASTDGQALMVRQFAEMALSPAPLRAKAGLRALSHLVMNNRPVLALLPPGTQAELSTAYFEQVRRGTIQPDKFLEPFLRTRVR